MAGEMLSGFEAYGKREGKDICIFGTDETKIRESASVIFDSIDFISASTAYCTKAELKEIRLYGFIWG